MSKNRRIVRSLFFISILILFAGTACSSSGKEPAALATSTGVAEKLATNPTATSPALPAPTKQPSSSQTTKPTQAPSPTPTHTQTLLPTLTATQTPLPGSPTPTSTHAILRGTVLEQANCRYGPGAAYLYKYGLYAGYNLEIIGRNETGTWIVIQAIGGTNPCWVKASLLNIKGDVMSLAPATLPLPQSPYYGPVTGVWGERKGNDVIISWNPISLRAGDDSLQYPYLIEAWLCQDGQFKFIPIGSWETMVTVVDEPGCSETSHARVYGVEKHGYTAWVTVPWP